MGRKNQIIQQGKVTELMTRIANLPERGKTANDPVSMSEIFRTKEYSAEIKAALKKGYTFENLSEIFTERCGVAVNARQIKYHFTRTKNRGAKGKPGKKAGESNGSGNHALSVDSSGKGGQRMREGNSIASDSRAKPFSNSPGFSFENRATAETKGDADPGAFPLM